MLLSLLLAAPVRAQTSPATVPIVGLCLAPELTLIPEVHTWPKYEPGENAAEVQRRFEQDWAARWREPVSKAVTVDLLRRLILQRDQAGLADYRPDLDLAGLEWRAITMQTVRQSPYLVFEATAADLPRVNAILRWLKIYCLYDVQRGAIIRVTLTIVGERDE
ncbi:hypothetical protein [Lignipirellula cremea]|uniref:hypothetical protein n=1 Tax=Lignipirellula cremea TaxID=2528010 RepID=UPI0011AAEA9C|nr:hypothetical protein [Lignipirellula cremea]